MNKKTDEKAIQQYYDNKYIIEEYQNEIIASMAICHYFKISINEYFRKYPFIIEWCFENHSIYYGKGSVAERVYSNMWLYCELFDKYFKQRKTLGKTFYLTILQARYMVKTIASIFNYDIIKVLAQKNEKKEAKINAKYKKIKEKY